MTLKNRIASLEEALAELAADDAPRMASSGSLDRHRAAIELFLSRVPADLRAAVASALGREQVEWAGEGPFHGLVSDPFARWAPPPPPDFLFPRALIETLLSLPRPVWLGNTCGTCGLCVPIVLTGPSDPSPPATVTLFPACPACNGRTSYTASFYCDNANPEGRHES
jgi:hypothetical protein